MTKSLVQPPHEPLVVSLDFQVLKNLIIPGNFRRSEQFIFVKYDWRLMDTIMNNLVKMNQIQRKQNLLSEASNLIWEQILWMKNNNTQFINQMLMIMAHFRKLLI